MAPLGDRLLVQPEEESAVSLQLRMAAHSSLHSFTRIMQHA